LAWKLIMALSMKMNFTPRKGAAVVVGVGGIIISNALFHWPEGGLEQETRAQEAFTPVPEITNKSLEDPIDHELPDQSHAMVDVGYHFANLWFAADKGNWPLAQYYLHETHSHLRWAVRLHPVRKTSAGDLDLKGILDSIDNSLLTEVDHAIASKDPAQFQTAYRQTMEACYACHKAAEKPFLRPQIPTAPAVSILNFDANATWPQ
jgi:hypothetical protein